MSCYEQLTLTMTLVHVHDIGHLSIRVLMSMQLCARSCTHNLQLHVSADHCLYDWSAASCCHTKDHPCEVSLVLCHLPFRSQHIATRAKSNVSWDSVRTQLQTGVEAVVVGIQVSGQQGGELGWCGGELLIHPLLRCGFRPQVVAKCKPLLLKRLL